MVLTNLNDKRPLIKERTIGFCFKEFTPTKEFEIYQFSKIDYEEAVKICDENNGWGLYNELYYSHKIDTYEKDCTKFFYYLIS